MDAAAAPVPGQPHVLLFPFPSYGHLSPILDLAKRLSGSGILCTLALTPFYHAAHSNSTPHLNLLRFAALPLPPDIHHKFSSSTQSRDTVEIVATRFVDPLRALILSYARHDIYASSDEHHDTLRLPPISCLISDSFMPWTVDLAAELGIPRVEMWTASVNCYAFGFYLPQLVSKGLIPFKQGTEDTPLDFLLGLSSSLLGHVPIGIAMTSPSSPIFELAIQMFARGPDSTRVLANSFYDLEADAIAALRANGVKMTPIGPDFGAEHEDDDGNKVTPLDEAQLECLHWLDKQKAKSVVYVAFGSTGLLTDAEIPELATALEVVGCPFLWAIRDGSATESLPENFRSGRLPVEKGLIVSWAPQKEVLGHASVGAFVSHCGWNSTLESIWKGVPIVGCPRMAEQNTNLWLMQEWGFGVSGVDTIMGGIGSVRSATLIPALRRVMGTPGIDNNEELSRDDLRKKVDEVTLAAHVAMSPSGTSTQAFQEFVSELVRNC